MVRTSVNQGGPSVTEDHLAWLSRVELFESLSQEELGKIANGIPAKRYAPGEHFYTAAYTGDFFFLLLKGRGRVYRLEAQRELTIGILEAGEMFGEGAFAVRGEKGSYAQALVPSRAAFVKKESFHRLVHEYPQVGIKAVELLSERLSYYEKRIATVGLKRVPSRLAGVILDIAEREAVVTSDGHYRIGTRYTHEEFAGMIGAKRVAVSRAMGELRRVGAIETKNRHCHIIDAEALARIATAA